MTNPMFRGFRKPKMMPGVLDYLPKFNKKAPYPNFLDNINSSTSTIQPGDISHRTIEDDVLPETAVLGRNLGWSSAYIIIISRVIGSGIFATPGAIVTSVGSIGLSLTLWIAGALISWCGLAVGLEYGCMLPRSGGSKVYLEFTYRRPRFLASILVSVHALVLGFTSSNCIVFGEYLLFALGKVPAEHPTEMRVLAVGLMTLITVIHGCFLKTGIFLQNLLGWIKIGLVLFMTIASLAVVIAGYRPDRLGEGKLTNTFPTTWEGIWEGSVWNWGIISTALFKVFYSYSGLENVNNVLNEVRDPVRTLKSAAPTALVTACMLYFVVNVAYFLIVPLDEIKKGGEMVAALFFQRVFGPTTGNILLPLAVATSAAGNVMVVTFACARLNQEITRQGLFPYGEILSSSRPFGAPLGALIIHWIPSVIVICVPKKSIYSFILEVEGYPAQFFVLATSLGIIWLRKTRPDLKRPYKAVLPAVWFRVVLSIALLAAPFVPRAGESGRDHFARVSYALVGMSVHQILLSKASIHLKYHPSFTMATATVETKHNVLTTFNYFKDIDGNGIARPFEFAKPETFNNRETEPQEILVTDITGEEDKFTLDGQGFQIYRHASKEKDFVDDEKIKRDYYPEVEQLLKDATGASRVHIFDHTIRRSSQSDAVTRGPAKQVHVDQSYQASFKRVQRHLPDEAEELSKKRFQIINVWRPIKTVYKDPLGYADANSVPESDLVPVKLIYPDHVGETYSIKPNTAHKWYFKYAQTPEEVTLIKCFDTKDEPGVARRVPHSAFTDPAEEDKDVRESIEVRTLVFYD
ncbi:amino acid permease-domain-containing protein [Cladorrhinum sp. PSN259]|nr:amino acid permease-domain-containing protein [Cladorrhinum sp. PSN259]